MSKNYKKWGGVHVIKFPTAIVSELNNNNNNSKNLPMLSDIDFSFGA